MEARVGSPKSGHVTAFMQIAAIGLRLVALNPPLHWSGLAANYLSKCLTLRRGFNPADPDVSFQLIETITKFNAAVTGHD